MLSERDTKVQIQNVATELFHQFGFHKVTVDEIVSKIGISKKTFYKHFESKETLVLRLIENNLEGINTIIDKLMKDSKIGYREKIEELLSATNSVHAKFSMPFMQDIIKYLPDTVNKIQDSSINIITENFKILFKQGVEKNVFRADVDVDIFLNMYFHFIQKMHDPKILSNISYSLDDIRQMILKILFEGILTKDARS
jgi:AcrR family transcriptional regulator